MRCLLALGLLLLAQTTSAAIVDTLKGFDADAPGWSGEIAASFALREGNSEVMAIGSGAQVQWQSTLHRVRLLGGYDRLTNRGNELDERALLHLRHNRHLVGSLYSLTFAQVQHNPFQRLRSRTLLGAGARWDVVRDRRANLSWGLSHMVEIERIQDEDSSGADQRLSTFLTVDWQLSENAELTASGFAQPLWSDLEDLRAIGQLTLSVGITERIKLVVGGSLQHDANPPAGVEETDLSTETGITLEL